MWPALSTIELEMYHSTRTRLAQRRQRWDTQWYKSGPIFNAFWSATWRLETGSFRSEPIKLCRSCALRGRSTHFQPWDGSIFISNFPFPLLCPISVISGLAFMPDTFILRVEIFHQLSVIKILNSVPLPELILLFFFFVRALWTEQDSSRVC